jgi:hypothetical protein
VDLQGDLQFPAAVMWWPLIILSLHDHVPLMQALGRFIGHQALREAHLSILLNQSDLQVGIHLMLRTMILLSRELKVFILMVMRGFSTRAARNSTSTLKISALCSLLSFGSQESGDEMLGRGCDDGKCVCQVALWAQ